MTFSSGRQWDFVPNEHYVRDVFTAEERAKIIATHTSRDVMPISVKTDDYSYRDTDVFWLRHGNPEFNWIYERVAEATLKLNAETFQFELEACTDFQLARYRPGQHYEWHSDLGAKGYSRRKLSTVVLLNDKSEFEGSNLQFGGDEFTRNAQLNTGDAIFFPSWMRHRVTPVTKGIRWTLVGWWLGPPFK